MPSDKSPSRRSTKRGPRARAEPVNDSAELAASAGAASAPAPVESDRAAQVGASWSFDDAEVVARIGQELRRRTAGDEPTPDGGVSAAVQPMPAAAPLLDEQSAGTPTQAQSSPVEPVAGRIASTPSVIPPADTRLVESAPTTTAEILREHQADLVQRELALVQREQRLLRLQSESDQRVRDADKREQALARRQEEIGTSLAQAETRLREIEGRSAEFNAREAALGESARELESRSAALGLRGEELEQLRARLSDKQGAVDRQEKTVSDRAAALSRGEGDLRQRLAELVQQRGLVEQEREKARADIEARMKDATDFRQELVRRLNSARAKLRLRESAADSRDEQVARQSADLDARQESVYRQHAVAERRRAELDEQQTQLEHTRKQAEHARALVDQEHGRNEREAARLVALESDLRQKLEGVAKRQREMDDAQAQARKRSADFDKKHEELERWRKSAKDDRAVLDKEADRLAQRERELDQQRRALGSQQQQLASREGELARAREALETTIQETVEIENRARKKLEDAEAISLQLAAREADLGQTSLQLNIEREALGMQQGEVISRQDSVAYLHAEAQRVLRESQAAAEHRVDESARAAFSIPRRTAWSRTTAAALGLGAAAALLTWFLNPREAVSVLPLKITTQRDEARLVAAEYTRLLDPARPRDPSAPQSVALDAWDQSRIAGRLAVAPSSDGAGFELVARGSDAEANARVLADAANLAAAIPETMSAQLAPAPRMTAWKQSREALTAQFAAAKGRVDEHRGRLQKSEGFERWSQARQAFETIEQGLARNGQRLATQRGLWTAQRDQSAPISEPPPDALDRALETDTAFQEDLRELDLASREYRVEVGAVMARVEPLLMALRGSVKQWALSLEQQRSSDAPPRLLALLEHTTQAAAGFDARIAGFLELWTAQRDQVGTQRSASATEPLLRDEARVALEAKRLVSAGGAVTEEFEARLRELTEGADASAREQVAAAAVRGATAPLRQSLLELTRTVRPLDSTENFRLDAVDRQLRGLRIRLADRREWLRGDLARRHAERTRVEYEQKLRDLESEVHELERERDELTAALGERVAEMKGLEGQVESLRQAAADLRAAETISTDLERRLAEHDTARPSIPPDRFAIGSVETRIVGGTSRAARSLGVGAGVSSASLIPALLLLLARPRDLSKSNLPGVNTATTASPAVGAKARA